MNKYKRVTHSTRIASVSVPTIPGAMFCDTLSTCLRGFIRAHAVRTAVQVRVSETLSRCDLSVLTGLSLNGLMGILRMNGNYPYSIESSLRTMLCGSYRVNDCKPCNLCPVKGMWWKWVDRDKGKKFPIPETYLSNILLSVYCPSIESCDSPDSTARLVSCCLTALAVIVY